MDKPCFWHDTESKCLREEGESCAKGTSWNACEYGKLNACFEESEKAKLALAQKIGNDIINYMKYTKSQPYEPSFRSQLTKLIKRRLL